MSVDYVTSAELKSTLSLSGETYADADIALAIAAASRAIDNMAGRRFFADADAQQVRYYTPDRAGADEVLIDDLVAITALASDPAGQGTFTDAWTPTMDFVLWPLNALADGRPWTVVQRTDLGRFAFPARVRSVRVTGQFGWPAVPPEIRAATGILASKLLKRAREAPFGIVQAGFDEGNAVRIGRQDPQLSELVGPYRLPGVA